MADDVVITVNHVSKDFVLPHEKTSSVKSAFMKTLQGKRSDGADIQHALQDVSFDVKRGEFFGIVGRNGSGKSTLLKILAGIYQPSKGSVTTTGKLVPFIELGVGFNPELTGRENVYLNGAMLGFSHKEIEAMYEDIVKFAEIERFMDQKLKNYSSGMQVRLAFSMATRSQADILLVDEVLAVGDADFQRKCFAYFRALKKHKVTVVFVSHDMNAIREYCDRAILIEDSHLVEEGSSAKIASAYSHLFMGEQRADETPEQKRSLRWGNGDMQFTSVSCEPSTIRNEPAFRIKMTVEVNKDLDDAIFGFSVKNTAEVMLFGTNTQLAGQKFTDVKSGQIIHMEWEILNILNDGEYFINLAAETGAATPCDWWEEAHKFTVRKESHTGFLIYPDISLHLDYDKKD
jgi:ABC-2 type transport system ATP-binding protein